LLILAAVTAIPHRPDRMDDMPRRQQVALGNLRFPSLAAAERAALFQKRRASAAMNGPIDPAATHQRLVGGVDNRIDA
jgi:hypothetical protein